MSKKAKVEKSAPKKSSSEKAPSKKGVDLCVVESLEISMEMTSSSDGGEGGEPTVDLEELEEAAAEAASNRSSGEAGLSAEAMAAASTEVSANLKNFRHHPDMENFYRFIHENDLRQEALVIMDKILDEKIVRKHVKSAKALAH